MCVTFVGQLAIVERKVFIRSAKVFPLAAQTGWKPNPHMFRRVVGTTEVVCGTLLAIVPGPIKEIANVILFALMCGAVYTHYALKDGIEKMTPALVFGLLLGCRFIVHLQVKAREAKQGRQVASKKEHKIYHR
ncbi:hypothetical protein LSAT2_030420 [Lamellibrachia satsuma]|nr:hypothetical protein LSAT2_030420 [Lamellibrachia satsuma]